MIFSFKGRLLVGMGIFLGVILIFYWLFYLPQTVRVHTIEAEIRRENVRIRELERKTKELTEVKEKYQELTNRLAQAEILPLTEKGFHNFLHELGLRGEIYGISFLNLSPKSTISGKYYDSIPIEITLRSTYYSLGMLLSALAEQQKEIPFTIDDISITALEGEELRHPGGSYSHSIQANLTVSLYLYKESSLSSYKSPEEILKESLEKKKIIKQKPEKRR